MMRYPDGVIGNLVILDLFSSNNREEGYPLVPSISKHSHFGTTTTLTYSG